MNTRSRSTAAQFEVANARDDSVTTGVNLNLNNSTSVTSLHEQILLLVPTEQRAAYRQSLAALSSGMLPTPPIADEGTTTSMDDRTRLTAAVEWRFCVKRGVDFAFFQRFWSTMNCRMVRLWTLCLKE